MVAVRNSNHFGMTAYFSMLAQAEGLIGFACTNAGARMAPTGGTPPATATTPGLSPSHTPKEVSL